MNAHNMIIFRRLFSSVLLVLLLIQATAMTSIGYSSLNSAKKQVDIIDEQYTTIAVPSGKHQEKLSESGAFSYIGVDSVKFSDGTQYIGAFDAESTAKQFKQFKGVDHRVLLSAYINGSKPLSSGTLDPLQYNFMLDRYSYLLSVMALRCTYVEETDTYGNERSYWAEFEIVDDVCRIDAYDLPPYEDTLGFESQICTTNGEIPFTVGNTYLVRGLYWDYDIRQVRDWVTNEEGVEQYVWVEVRDVEGLFKPRSLLVDPEYPLLDPLTSETGVTNGLPNWILERKQYPDSDKYYWCTPDDCWPYYTEYVGEWEAYLNSEDGLVWKNEIIPYFEMNHASVPVILTDNIESMYYFNTGDASILEGTIFTETDYKNGNAVCLVSASYAQLNGLDVGDTINLDYYKTGYGQEKYTIVQGSGRTGLTIQRYPLSENTRIGVQQEYTVVGIYSAPEWEAGIHSFHADTIIVPKASVPNADQYAGVSLTLLNSVIIENGSIDAFEAHMAANNKAGVYLYFDQGFSEAISSVQILIANAQRILIIGISMFILSSLLFLLLYIRRTAPVIRTMRLLGVSSRKTWHECFVSLLWQVVIAVFIGNTLAINLYDRITQMVLSTSLELSYGSVVLCGSVQLLVLLVAGILWIHSVANRNLMQKR